MPPVSPVLRRAPRRASAFAAAFAAALAALMAAAPTAAAQSAQPGAVPDETRRGGHGHAHARLVGTVVDAATGEPLPAATVRVLGLGRGELTHDDGTFSLDDVPLGVHTVSVQRLGYAPGSTRVAVVAGDAARVRIALRAAAASVEAVVVTGTVGERPGRDVLSPTTVLDGAALDRRAGPTLAETVRGQPGVSVASVGPATARPVIRGLGGDRILLLEDGQRPGDLSAMSGDHAVAVEALTARQVEVVRGPMSLLYGPNALGGVVNVVRDEIPTSRPEHAQATLSVQGTSVNRGATVGGSGAMALGRVVVRGEGSARDAGDLRTPAGTLTNTAVRTYNASTGAALVGERGHLGASYRLFDSRYGIPAGFVGSHPAGVEIDMRRHAVRAEGERRGVGPIASTRVTATYTDYEHREFATRDRASTRFGQDVGALDALARHAALGPLTSGAVGGRVQYRDIVTGGSLRTPSTQDVNAALFVVEEWARGRLNVQGGVRGDWARYEPQEAATIDVGGELVPVRPRTFAAASGSLGALWDAGGGWRLGTSVSRAFRTPDFNELYSDGPHLAANSYDVGNPELDAETGLGVDAFARVSRGRVRADLAAFLNRIDGYIYPRNTGELGRAGGRYKFQYVGRDARLFGAEADAELALTPRWVLDASASWVRGTLVGRVDSLPAEPALGLEARPGSSDLPFIPPLNGRGGVRWETPRAFAGGGLRWAARQDRVGDFEEPTAGYVVGDVHAGIRLLAGARLHAITLRVDNLLDREYRDHLSRTKQIMPEAGRNVSLLYRLVF